MMTWMWGTGSYIECAGSCMTGWGRKCDCLGAVRKGGEEQ